MPGAFLLINRTGIANLDIKDILAIGAILSATDSVCTLQVLSQEETPLLYGIVFGEGVVNDAMSIVLFNSVQSLNFSTINAVTALELLGTFLYLFCTSTVLGIVVGLLSAYLIKTFYFGRHSTDREVALMMLMAYFSYMIAELLELSGILTIFVCGIVMSHYTWHNVTENSRITTKHSFATISFISETFIFLYVGMDALDIDKWKTSIASVGTLIAVSSTFIALVLIGRASLVFPIANIVNCFMTRENTRIEFRSQFVIWWAGLMRGAVTIALSCNQFLISDVTSTEDSALMITSTITLVLFSTMVFGSITKPLIEVVQLRHSRQTVSDSNDYHDELRLLFLNGDDSINETMDEPLQRRTRLSLMMRYPATTVHYYWKQFDYKFMRPIFGGRDLVPVVPGTPLGED